MPDPLPFPLIVGSSVETMTGKREKAPYWWANVRADGPRDGREGGDFESLHVSRVGDTEREALASAVSAWNDLVSAVQ